LKNFYLIIEKTTEDRQNEKIDNMQSVFKEIDSEIVLISKSDKKSKKQNPEQRSGFCLSSVNQLREE